MSDIDWNPEAVAELAAMVKAGATRKAMMARFDCTTGAIAGAIFRHVKPPKREVVERVVEAPKPTRNVYTESKLTEPWTKYHARKVAERAAAKGERIMEMA